MSALSTAATSGVAPAMTIPLHQVKALALSRIRTARPYVIWGAEPMNGGNFLYLWATAWARRRERGESWVVRYKPKMEPWLNEFPALRPLTVNESEIGWRQRRTVEWGQQINKDFRFKDIRDFARELLLTSDTFQARMKGRPSDAVVVNIRRGDYYSDPRNRAVFGFDIPGYVAAALDRVPGDETQRIVVVSDDPDWCAHHLRSLLERGDVAYMPDSHDMFEDLAQLTVGRHLVLANSTFSYWGGYMASARAPHLRPRSVQAPLHFNRLYSDGESPLLLPEWRAIPDDEFVTEDSNDSHR